MKINKKMQISLAAALLLVCGTAFAYTVKQEPAAVYVGFQPGYANMHYDKKWFFGNDSSGTVGSINNSGLAGRLYLGYDFNKNFGVETGYILLPKIKFNNIYFSKANFSFNQNVFDFFAKLTMPLQYDIDIYGKAGVAMVVRDDAELSYEGQTAESNSIDRKTVPVIGIGADYGFNDHVFADLSYMRYFEQDDVKPIDFIGIGVVYRF